MTAHACAECGMLHDVPTQIENPEVAIARIQAESALKIAQLAARTDLHQTEVWAETDLAIAETHAEGDLAETELIAGALVEGVEPEPEVEPQPVVVIADDHSDDHSDDATELPDIEEEARAKPKALEGLW